MGREGVSGVGDDVGVRVLGKLEAKGKATRAGSFRMVIRNIRNAGEIGEAY
jgi:hypothetical protein